MQGDRGLIANIEVPPTHEVWRAPLGVEYRQFAQVTTRQPPAVGLAEPTGQFTEAPVLATPGSTTKWRITRRAPHGHGVAVQDFGYRINV